MKRLLLALAAFAAALGSAPAAAQSYSNEETYIDNTIDTSDVITSSEDVSSGDDEQKVRFHCEITPEQTNFDDHLLYPGLAGASPHGHQYFGNKGSNYASTYSSLRTTGDSSCRGNKAARQSYWQPAMRNGDGKQVIAEYVQVYYKREHPYAPVYRMPNGLKIITGNKPGDPNYYVTPVGVTLGPDQYFTGSSGFAGFSCVSHDTPKYQSLSDPSLLCDSGDMLRADFVAPNCWDGVNIESVDQRRHVVHQVGSYATGHPECPPSHPYQIPQVQYAEFWQHCGYSNPALACSYRTYYVDSDRQDPNPANWAANGTTFHLDLHEAWNKGVRDEFEQYCVGVGGTGKPCNDGYIGNLRRLIQNVDYTEQDLAHRYIDMPARASSGRGKAKLRIIN